MAELVNSRIRTNVLKNFFWAGSLSSFWFITTYIITYKKHLVKAIFHQFLKLVPEKLELDPGRLELPPAVDAGIKI